jgi:hypothetical protein
MLPAPGSPDPGNSRPRAQRIERGSPVTTLAGLLVADGSQSPTMKRLCTGSGCNCPRLGAIALVLGPALTRRFFMRQGLLSPLALRLRNTMQGPQTNNSSIIQRGSPVRSTGRASFVGAPSGVVPSGASSFRDKETNSSRARKKDTLRPDPNRSLGRTARRQA